MRLMGSKKKAKQKRRKLEQARREQRRLLEEPGAVRISPAAEEAVLSLTPRAGATESLEDRAVFDSAALEQLPEDLAAEAGQIRESLRLVEDGLPKTALDRLREIGRRSPYADWRLLLRGLVHLYAGDLLHAVEAWQRLDPARRPARIAAVLQTAWEDALATSDSKRRDSRPAPAEAVAHRSMWAVASIVMRREWIWKAADEIVSPRRRSADSGLSPEQATQTNQLVWRSRMLDPDFAQAFLSAARYRTMQQGSPDVFGKVCGLPLHPSDDPKGNRLRLFFMESFYGSSNDAEGIAETYLERDLPTCTELPHALREAMAGLVLFRLVCSIVKDDRTEPEHPQQVANLRLCVRLMKESVRRCPANTQGHEMRIRLLRELSDEIEDDATEHAEIQRELNAAIVQFAQADAGNHGVVAALIGDLIDREAFALAEPLVKNLAEQRVRDEAALAVCWRFPLARLASQSKAGEASLDPRRAVADAVACWPPTVRRDWIPFLEGVACLRSGDDDGYCDAVEAGISDEMSPLLVETMLYQAGRLLDCHAEQIEASGEKVAEAAASMAVDSPLEPFLEVAAFFNMLRRLQLARPAAAGSPEHALGTALCRRLTQQGKWKLKGSGRGDGFPLDNPDFFAAFEWLGENNFFDVILPTREPGPISRLCDAHPRAAAAMLGWRARRAPLSLDSRRSLKRISLVEKACTGEADVRIADGYREVLELVRQAQREIPPEDDDDEFDDGLPFGPVSVSFGGMGGGGVPPILRKLVDRGGIEALSELMSIIEKRPSAKSEKRLDELIKRLGLARHEVLMGIMEMMERIGG
jgi:hypothetical protein